MDLVGQDREERSWSPVITTRRPQGPQLPATIYVAPRFETCDERYLWLNRIQAVGKGTLQEDGLSLYYEWYEVRWGRRASDRSAEIYSRAHYLLTPALTC